MRAGVLCALGSAGEAAVVAAVDAPGTGLEVVRRCADLAEALALAIAGAGRVVLLSASLPGVDRAAVSRLEAAGSAVVLVADPGEVDRCRALGASATVASDDGVAAVVRQAQALARSRGEAPRPDAAGALGRPDGDTRRGAPARSAPADVGVGGGNGELPGRGREDAPTGPNREGEPAARGREGEPGQAPGRLVAVWGPHGAPGRTTVAVNLAAELAEAGATSLLIDADTYGGCVAQVLGMLDESPGLAAAVRAASNGVLDRAALARLAPPVQPGMRVLTGIPRPDRWRELTPAGLDVVLRTGRDLAGWTVVDCGFSVEDEAGAGFEAMLGPRRNGAALSALRAADVVVAVGAGEPVGVQRLVQGLADLADAGLPPAGARLVVVANRVRASAAGPRPERAVTEALVRYAGVTDLVVVPDDRPSLDRAVLTGRTLSAVARQSPARAAIAHLAAELVGQDGEVAARRRRDRRGRAA